MRLFIASGFSVPVLDRVRDLQNFAKPLLGDPVKWVEPGDIHLTYVFLGDVAQEWNERQSCTVNGRNSANKSKLPAIRKSMDETAGAFRKTSVTLGGFGAFPSLERPRVLWLGLKEGGDALKAMALKLYGSLTAEGFIFEHEFSAHITIARVKGRLDRVRLRRMAEKAEELDVGDTVASLNLMESRLTALGPEYRALYSKELL